MKHFHQDIPGYFDYEDIYRQMVAEAGSGDIFIELGVLCGKSTAFMCVEIVNSGKDIQFYAVDNFTQGTKEAEIRKLLKPFKFCHVRNSDSVEFMLNFRGEAKFIFIDTDHHVAPLAFELMAAKRIAGRFGYIGGHDYTPEWPEVKYTADLFCKIYDLSIQQINNSFLIEL